MPRVSPARGLATPERQRAYQWKDLARLILPQPVIRLAAEMGEQDPVPRYATQTFDKALILVSDISGFTRLSVKY